MKSAEAAGTHKFPAKAAIVRRSLFANRMAVNVRKLSRRTARPSTGSRRMTSRVARLRAPQAVEAFEFLRTVLRVRENPNLVDCARSLGIARPGACRRYMLSGEDVSLASFDDSDRCQRLADRAAVAGDVIFKSANPGSPRLYECRIACCAEGLDKL